MKYLLVASALAATLFSAPAAANELVREERFHAGNWRGTSHWTADRNFSHCSMYAAYKSGISVFFAIDAGFKWRIGFQHARWSLTPGAKYSISYAIDHFPTNVARAEAATTDFAIAELPATSQIFQQFRIGRMLIVNAEGETMTFSLGGTSRALAELLECAKEGKTRVAAVAPRSKRPGPFSTQDDRAALEEKLEATRVVANLLSRSEFRDYKLMSSQEMSDPDAPEFVRTAAVAWRAPGTLGVLHVVAPNGSIDDMVAATISEDAAACKGTFASGKVPDPEISSIRRAFSICKDSKDVNGSMSYIFVPRKNGTVYKFGTFSLDQVEESRPEDRKLREALKGTML